ncbi:galactose-1-phosphate uridylyltransferase (plasmid) [Bacillus thuringiensis serovar coreanensis]|nr:galactose-1-phosphate uridylyltransferase [Bacillus thuringiensis serovar coreanensis]MED1305213.1 UDP-glucose--hexose-1-phosphate uridylyltransferase [Bacillus pacificus]
MIYSYIEGLIKEACKVGIAQERDHIYLRNQILGLLKLNVFVLPKDDLHEVSISDFVDLITDYAVDQGIVQPFLLEKDIFGAKLMNIFISKPSEISKLFWGYYNYSPKKATNYFYELSQASNYIQIKHIKKNICYKASTEYGELDITINLSKPEKDPKEIARERLSPKSETKYPKCLLCVENEGFIGHLNHPARANHRIIPLELGKERWYLQYSPYLYYREHCILLSEEHRDMKINFNTFYRLLDFVRQFPHYFAGSNADLPIVGGSILTHDHYQGGQYEFPIGKAKEENHFHLEKFPSIEAMTICWPLSIIRLRSSNLFELASAAGFILEVWKTYNDETQNILSYTGTTRHNTITPIARMRNGLYEIDLALRNNRTSNEYPLGIFHPHPDVHHIKKENIGLIEVMGLAILPPRLKADLLDVKKYIRTGVNVVKKEHLSWAQELKAHYEPSVDLNEYVNQAIAMKFVKGLEDCGVFKRTGSGRRAFLQFIQTIKKA